MHISQWSKSDTRWYLGVLCRKCEAPILFAVDRSDEGHFVRTEKLVLTCTQIPCRHQDDYSSATVARFQKQQPATINEIGSNHEDEGRDSET